MNVDAFLTNFWPNFFGTVIGGFTLSVAFFVFKEWVFSLPTVTGIWECELITSTTEYRPYDGMRLWYRISLLQSDTHITGVGELRRECSASGSLTYEGVGRRKVDVSGTVSKRILRPDVIQMTWIEHGQVRVFSSVFLLKVSGSKTSGNLWGTFASTSAESRGNSMWRRLSQ
jgi:hypothetical protein